MELIILHTEEIGALARVVAAMLLIFFIAIPLARAGASHLSTNLADFVQRSEPETERVDPLIWVCTVKMLGLLGSLGVVLWAVVALIRIN